jgi:hypothetical protein
MDTLPPELYNKCRHILLACNEFQSNESLRSIFIVGRLSVYRDRIPDADSIDLRVDRCMAFLHQESWQNDSMLAFFLEVLRDRYEEDNRRRELDDLAKNIRMVLNNILFSQRFDVILRFCDTDTESVENLAKRLKDAEQFNTCLDKWTITTFTQSWQQVRNINLFQTGCCAICIGEQTPPDWVEKVAQEALDHQKKNVFFRIIPVLLPGVRTVYISHFPELRSWTDFRSHSDHNEAFRILTHGIKGIALGKQSFNLLNATSSDQNDRTKYKLRKLNEYKEEGLIDENEWKESKRKVLDRYLLIDD